METGDLEFDFFLTEKLGYRTVGEMQRRMPYREYRQWGVYYGRIGQRKELAAKSGG